MDFFKQQDIARRNTRMLVLLFLVAVFLLILLTNAVVAAFLYFGQDYNIYAGSRDGMAGFLSYFSWERFGYIGLAVTATVALVVFFKWIQLSTGGKVVAESMGGVRILPQTSDPAERRCLNVVEGWRWRQICRCRRSTCWRTNEASTPSPRASCLLTR